MKYFFMALMSCQFISNVYAVSTLVINGQNSGSLQTYSGGMPKALVSENLSTAKKNVEDITIDSLVFSTSNADAFLSSKWIQDSINIPGTRKDITINECDDNNRVTSEHALAGNVISEIRISEFEAADKSVGSISIEAIPTTSNFKRIAQGPTCKALSNKAKAWLKSNFKLEIAKLDSKNVKKISDIKIKFGDMKDATGNKFGVAKFENIFVTVTGASINSWLDWYNSFIVLGKNRDEDELQGSLTVLDSSFKQEILKLNLQNIGIVSMKHESANDNRVESVTFELYVEKVSF